MPIGERIRGRLRHGLHNPLNVDPTLVLDLPFSEGIGDTVRDRSLYGNHGTIYGASWIDGKIGKALSFDGVDDYVQAPFPTQLLGNNPHTIELWLKLKTGLNSYSDIIAVGKEEATKLFRLSFQVVAPYAMKILRWFYGVNPGGVSNIAFELERWYHIVETYEPNTSKFYIDGVLTSTITGLSPNPNLEAGYVELGLSRLGWDYFKGTLDEVRVYNRALTAEEVTFHYGQSK